MNNSPIVLWPDWKYEEERLGLSSFRSSLTTIVTLPRSHLRKAVYQDLWYTGLHKFNLSLGSWFIICWKTGLLELWQCMLNDYITLLYLYFRYKNKIKQSSTFVKRYILRKRSQLFTKLFDKHEHFFYKWD